MEHSILSLVVWAPFVAAVVLVLAPTRSDELLRRLAFAFSLGIFVLSLGILRHFDATSGALQLVEARPWLPSIGVGYSLGIDGFSLWLVLLATFLAPIILLSGWHDIEHRQREYLVFMFLLEWGMLGALCATDLFLFFTFWELMLFPMAFIIGIWGGPRRRYAAVKFVLYTMAGSALMLVAILYVVLRQAGATGRLDFNALSLYANPLGYREQVACFAAFALAFMIKVPMVPLHTWLPDAHTEAPTGGSVNLAGVLLKLGAYGFLRFAIPMFPLAAQDAFPLMMALAVVGILYGAMVAFPQPDMKRLVAYSSVSHLGYVVLGLWAFDTTGISGSVLQMVNHGLSTGALFILVGYIYHRRHTRLISEYGGLWSLVPVFSALLLVVTFSSISLPGTNGFVGEFLILLGASRVHPVAAALGTLGVILGAGYMLTMFQRVAFGPVTNEENRSLRDLDAREIAAVAPILVLVFWIGFYPRPFLSRIEPTVHVFLDRLAKAGAKRHLDPAEGRMGTPAIASAHLLPEVHAAEAPAAHGGAADAAAEGSHR